MLKPLPTVWHLSEYKKSFREFLLIVDAERREGKRQKMLSFWASRVVNE
jgi:hypothetical protein